MNTAKTVKTVEGTSLNARNGQQIEDGRFDVRELTARERSKLPACVARLDGPAIAGGDSRVCLSVDTETTTGGHYILVTE